jgi:hypothetical protein
MQPVPSPVRLFSHFSQGFFPLIAFLSVVCSLAHATAAPWRSSLYPTDWKPGFADDEGRFLHDFSYAGYGRGEEAIPSIAGPVIDVTQPPYSADPDGKENSTAAIQAAIDEAGRRGGGVVFLPEGTYRIAPPSGASSALRIAQDNVILRGGGPDKTFLFNDETSMRFRSVIEVKAIDSARWYSEDADLIKSPASRDIPNQSTVIPVQNASLFSPGDLVMIRNDLTDRFIAYLGMTGKWTRENMRNRALMFCRRIVSVDLEAGALTIDVPTRYDLKIEDGARVQILQGKTLSGVGIEDLSIGMKAHPGSTFGDRDFGVEGTAAYEVHQAHAIVFESSENCWVRRIHSYSPQANPDEIHTLSNGIRVSRSRLVTVEDCDFRNPQYLGEGGNGYHFIVQGNDSLFRRCKGSGGRHNYSFASMASSGNVLVDCLSKDGRLALDFHSFFSVSNLLDNVTCDGDFIEAKYRPHGGVPEHGVTTSQSVIWNTEGINYIPATLQYGGKTIQRPQQIVLSEQFGNGYVIGTRGPAYVVSTTNFVEGVGKGDNLEPRSLYLDQLSRRVFGQR